MEHTNATTDATLTEHLSAVDNIDDPRSEAMRISMAEHFEDSWVGNRVRDWGRGEYRNLVAGPNGDSA